MTQPSTLQTLLAELENSLDRLETEYAAAPAPHLHGPLLRRRRAVALLRSHAGGRILPRRTQGDSPPGLPGLIEGEQSLVHAYERALEADASKGPVRKLLLELKSESEQALLAFTFHQRRSRG